MNRFDFQKLADFRIQEAEGLLKLGLSDGAYYLAGYAVECALKACIAKNVKEFDYPPPQKVVAESYYTHDLNKLLTAAKLSNTLKADGTTNPGLEKKWQTVQDWSEQARYEGTRRRKRQN